MDISNIVEFFIHTAQAATEAAAHAAPQVAEVAGEVAHADEGILGKLGIDIRLFLFQLLNFGIILLVLWKWVFTPVAKKLTERTERVEKAMRDATDIEQGKAEFFQWKETEIVHVKNQTSALLTTAENEARKIKEQVALETKAEQEKIVNLAKQQIEDEKQKALREVKTEMADLVTLATEKILREKMTDKKDKQLVNDTLKELT